MRITRATSVAVLLLFSAFSAQAQNVTGHLARLTSTEGFVHIERLGRGNDTEGDPAQLNMPLIEGQSVVTSNDGRAEIEFEDGSLARLTPNTTLTLVRMGGASDTLLTLVQGLAYFELRYSPGISYSLTAGEDIVRPVENTTIRVNLDEPPAAVAVLEGTARVERLGSYGTDIHNGETFRADLAGGGRYFLTQEVAPDTWDSWNESRDEQAADAAARQTGTRASYAGDKGYGWSDLDANGTWYDTGAQGQVWQPQGGDSAGFDPYGNGSWVWYPAAGYIWASAYPWGWTPYRCGSWSYWNSFGWGWSPAGNCVNFGGGGYGYGGYGGYGGGGYNGGGLLNITVAPHNYPTHRLPPPRHNDGPHPIINVRSEVPASTLQVSTAPRDAHVINGVRATPIHGTALGYTPRGGSATGAGLLRDYPVDRISHTAVLGTQPGQTPPPQTIYGNGPITGAAILQRSVTPLGTARTARPQVYPQVANPQVVYPQNSPQVYPQVHGRGAVSSQPQQAPLVNTQPMVRPNTQPYAQPAMPRVSTPQPMAHPSYSAPAPMPLAHPSYNAPAAAPAPHAAAPAQAPGKH